LNVGVDSSKEGGVPLLEGVVTALIVWPKG